MASSVTHVTSMVLLRGLNLCLVMPESMHLNVTRTKAKPKEYIRGREIRGWSLKASARRRNRRRVTGYQRRCDRKWGRE